jgi:glycosyltransferase involved in cell wall biosynthesis
MFLPEDIGGTEIVTYNLAKLLAQDGHEVHVITSSKKKFFAEDIKNGFFVHRLTWHKIKILGVLCFWFNCFLLIKKIKPAVTHAQGVQIGLSSFISKKIFGIPYIVWGQGSDIFLKWKFKRIISGLVFKNADAVVVTTRQMSEKAIEICKKIKKIYLIPEGIDLKRTEGLLKGKIRNELGIEDGKKIILFVGRLDLIKGIKYLIEAMDSIKERDKNISLMLVGDGGERQNLEKMVKDFNLEGNIVFKGWIPNEDVPRYLVAADMFVLPSLSEGAINMEILAAGLPVVGTNVGGMPDCIKNFENGFLVEPKNPEQLTEKILALFKDEILMQKIADNNKERARGCSWENVIDKTEKLYLEVINGNGRSL